MDCLRWMAVAASLACVLTACGSDSASGSEMHPTVSGMRLEPDEQGLVYANVPSVSGAFTVRVEWPLAGREASLRFFSAGYRELEVDDVKVRLLMPEHGHDGLGLPKVARAMPAVERWHVTDLAPSMSGNWELRIDATVQGKTDRATLFLHFPASVLEPVGAHGHS